MKKNLALRQSRRSKESKQEPELSENEHLSMKSQVSEDDLQTVKLVKDANGIPIKIGTPKTPLEKWLASNIPPGSKRDHSQTKQ